MSYEDFEEVRAKRATKDQSKAGRGRKYGPKRKSTGIETKTLKELGKRATKQPAKKDIEKSDRKSKDSEPEAK